MTGKGMGTRARIVGRRRKAPGAKQRGAVQREELDGAITMARQWQIDLAAGVKMVPAVAYSERGAGYFVQPDLLGCPFRGGLSYISRAIYISRTIYI